MPAARRLLLTIALIAAPLPAHAVPLLTADYTGLQVGTRPRLLASGDLTGDGVDDLVVDDDDGLGCLIARGDGTFAPRVAITPLHAAAIAIADVSGDGLADVVITGLDFARVAIFPGRGNGTFGAWFPLQFRSGSPGLLARDLDGDGFVDIVASDPGSRSIWVWLRPLDPKLGGVQVIDANVPPGPILSGDLDGDGAPDLFLLHNNAQAGFTLMRNDGHGAFGPPVLYDGPGGSRLGSTGDFDGDGVPDIAIPESYRYPETYAVAVWSGRRDGTFVGPILVPTAGLAGGVAVADLNGDGDDDLVIEGDSSGRWVHAGSATGIGSAYGLPEPSSASAPIVAGRFDGDTRTDLAGVERTRTDGALTICAPYTGSTVFVWRGDGAGGFERLVSRPLDPQLVPRVFVRDLDGDGHVDLLISRGTSPNEVLVEHGRGDGSFSDPITTPGMPAVKTMQIVDIDGDGHPEAVLVSAAPWALIVYDIDPSGRLTERLRQPVATDAFEFAAHDLDRDGHVDFAFTLHQTSRIAILFAGSDFSYTRMRSLPLPSPALSIAAADCDRDGIPDLLVGSDDAFASSPRLLEYKGLEDGAYVLRDSLGTGLPVATINVLDRGWHRDLDVIAGIGRQGCRDDQGGALVLRLVNGVFAREQGPLFLGGGVRSLEIADLDGDRIGDIVAAGNRGRVAVRLGRADGTYGERLDFGITPGVGAAAIADFDEDGRLDVAVPTLGGITLLPNVGGAVPVQPSVVARLGAGGQQSILSWGDTRPLPLVLAGTESVDVRTIDPSSFRLAGADPIRGRVKVGDGIAPGPPGFDACSSVVDDLDGAPDLEVVFRADEVLDGWLHAFIPLDPRDGNSRVVALPFTAHRVDGTSIEGSVCAVIVGNPDEALRASPISLRAFGLAPGFESGVGVVLTLPEAVGMADVAVYDVAGRRMATLSHDALPPGVHRLNWSGATGGIGRRPGAGIYFVRADIDGRRMNARILVTR